MSNSISILNGSVSNKSSANLRRSTFGLSSSRKEVDFNFFLYNNIYNNYLKLFIENKFEDLEEFNLIDSIISLAKFMDQVISTVLLDTLSVVQRGLIQYKENKALEQEVERLRTKIENIHCKKTRFNGTIKTDVDVNVSIDIKYILYIKEYGPPINGLFDSRKLAEVIRKYNLYNV